MMNAQTMMAGLLFTLLPLPGNTQEEKQGNGENALGRPETLKFFLEDIDFWGTRPKANTAIERPTETGKTTRENIWAEPVRMPDGRYSIYVPPRPVLDFLENPTEERLEGYLAWQQERALKLTKALKLLEEYRVRTQRKQGEKSPQEAGVLTKSAEKPPNGPPGGSTAPAPPSAKANATPTFKILYFHQKMCPHCERQDGMLARWLTDHPEATVKVVEFGESPELWRENNITGTPSLLFTDPATGRKTILVGLSDAARMDGAASAVRELPPKEPQAESSETSP